MQRASQRTSNTYYVRERCPTLTSTSAKDTCCWPPYDFTQTLPTEMSVRIFSELDVPSLCSASRTCRLWNHIIQDSDHLWRDHCQTVRAICQREVDGDRQDGLSWKVTLERNYKRGHLKRDWLRGRYSNVRCAAELRDIYMCPLDVETWGEILEAELER